MSGCAPPPIESQFESPPDPGALQRPADRSATESTAAEFSAGDADDRRAEDPTQPFLAQSRQAVPGLPGVSARRSRDRTPQSTINQFQEHYQARRYPEALAALREALRNRPDDPDILYWTALTHRAAGHPELAEPSLNRALEVAPNHLDSCKLLSVILMEDGRCAAAVRQIDQLVKSGGADAEAHLLRASAHMRCGDCPAAIDDATEALRRDAKLTQALLVRSAARLQSGQLDQAREDLEAARAAGVPASQSAPLAAQINEALRKAGR
ncbi:MAG: tetratricopeptide repeat protein [Planctomycetaceae bacterium]